MISLALHSMVLRQTTDRCVVSSTDGLVLLIADRFVPLITDRFVLFIADWCGLMSVSWGSMVLADVMAILPLIVSRVDALTTQGGGGSEAWLFLG